MENVKPMPRVLIAGANSGCGKTSITCGILKALVNRELHIQSYKCGPDYIDPLFHERILGIPSENLVFFSIHPRYSGGCFRSMEKGKIW